MQRKGQTETSNKYFFQQSMPYYVTRVSSKKMQVSSQLCSCGVEIHAHLRQCFVIEINKQLEMRDDQGS